MLLVERILLAIVIFFYILTVGLSFAGIFFKRQSWFQWSQKTFIIALSVQTISLIARMVITGHIPVKDEFENALTCTWVVALFYWYIAAKWSELWKIIGWVSLITLVTIGWAGQVSQPNLEPLTLAYQSPWLWVHVFFAWFGYAPLLLATLLSFKYLWSNRKGSFNESAASGVDLAEVTYTLIAFGFVMNAGMIATGSLWAHDLYGSYWSWDPVETWSLISWLIYAIYLHLRKTSGIKGTKAALLTIFAFITVLISAWGVNFFRDTYHIFQQMF